MKPSAILSPYFLRQSDAILKLLRKQPVDFTQEDFHALRVHIKRIKSIMALTIYSCRDSKHDKFLDSYKIIFDLAGKVRELQLQISILEKYTPETTLNAYYQQVQIKQEKAQHDFFELIRKPFLEKLKKRNKKILALFDDVRQKDVNRFLSHIRTEVEELLQLEKPEKEDYHKLRKKIKGLYYLQKLFQPRNKRMRLADEFQELLGEWHDYWLASQDLFADTQNHHLRPEEVKALLRLHQKVSKRANALFDRAEAARLNMN